MFFDTVTFGTSLGTKEIVDAEPEREDVTYHFILV